MREREGGGGGERLHDHKSKKDSGRVFSTLRILS